MNIPTVATKFTKARKAFTLIELIVAIVILAIISFIALVSYNSYVSNARAAALESDVAGGFSLLQAADTFGVAIPASMPAGVETVIDGVGSFKPNTELLATGGGGQALCVEGTNEDGVVYSKSVANGVVADTCGSASQPGTSSVVNAPGAPISVTATAGNGQVALSWTAPASNGGSAVTDYVVEYKTSAGEWTVFTDGVSAVTSVTVTGLTNGTSYEFRIAAVNVAGTSPWSANSAASVPFSPLALSYANTVFTAGSNNQTLAATVTGGFDETKTYSLTAGSLPAGITFDNTTGTFTGPGGAQWQGNGMVPTSPGTGSGRSVSVLADGSAIVTGSFQGTATFGSTTLTSGGGTDVFVGKIDLEGNWVWATRAGGGGNQTSRSISAMSDGSAIITGNNAAAWHSGGSITFGPVFTTNSPGMFVAKIGADGTWVWGTRVGGEGSKAVNDTGIQVATLSDGSALVTGNISSQSSWFGSTLLEGGYDWDNLSGVGSFIAKINASGTWVWAQQVGQDPANTSLRSSAASVAAMSVLSDGSAVFTGRFGGSPGWSQPQAKFGSTTLTEIAWGDVWVAKMNADRTWAWALQAGSGGSDSAYTIAAFVDGAAIVSGYLEYSGMWIKKVNADGTWGWTVSTPVEVRSMSALSDGSVIATGDFAGSTSFGSTNLISNGAKDVFVGKVNAIGTWSWATKTGGTSNDYGYSVSASADGSAIVTGSFQGTATFGSTSLVSAGGSALFVAKVAASGQWEHGPTFPGIPATFDVTVTDSSGTTTQSVTLTAN